MAGREPVQPTRPGTSAHGARARRARAGVRAERARSLAVELPAMDRGVHRPPGARAGDQSTVSVAPPVAWSASMRSACPREATRQFLPAMGLSLKTRISLAADWRSAPAPPADSAAPPPAEEANPGRGAATLLAGEY